MANIQNNEHKLKKELQKDLKIPQIVDEKMEDAYRQIYQGVVKQEQIRKSRRKVWGSVAAAACLVTVLGGTLYVNPALAKELPVVGNIFQKLDESRNAEEYGYKDVTAYKEIGEHAQDVTAAGSVAESSGVTLSVSDAYCDGYNLYFTLAATIGDEELKEADILDLLYYEESSNIPSYVCNVKINGNTETASTIFSLNKSEDGAFLQLVQVPLSQVQGDGSSSGNMDVTLEVNGIGVRKYNTATAFDESVKGDWKIAFQAQIDESNNVTAEPNAENNGFILRKAVKTPSNCHFTIEIPAEWTAANPAIRILDSAGNKIEFMQGRTTELENGNRLQEWTTQRSDSTEFTAQIFDKNSGTEEAPMIAEILFTVP